MTDARAAGIEWDAWLDPIIMNTECECKNWARASIFPLSEHHERCPKYEPPQPSEQEALFGKLMWEYIVRLGEDFLLAEISEDILPMAERAGLCRRVIYNPDKHGQLVECEPGEEIWFWGEEES